ncbi:hypothetical protein [Dokdonella sp.]|uniref:hypothetical protein n=1 Tax=Dokdonella sp. TaxID=2291710 RepID=UPI001B27F112|nr:hypothetical protein [Dokdonella sp.]MBO9662847.1 hypothetical protein [Dokdonella sp.]
MLDRRADQERRGAIGLQLDRTALAFLEYGELSGLDGFGGTQTTLINREPGGVVVGRRLVMPVLPVFESHVKVR